MKIYAKYIIANLAGPVFFITVSLTCVVWLTQALRYVEYIINQGLPVKDFLYLISLLLPSLLGMVLPIAILCSTIYMLNRLSYESELLVLKAAGISRFGIARPALFFGMLAMCFAYLISLYFLPLSYSRFRDLQHYFRDNYASLMIEEGIFNTPIPGFAVYVKERASDGTLRGILMHDSRDAQRPVTYMAEEGTLEKGQNGMVFKLEKASRQQINRKSGEVNILYFDSYPLDISYYTEANQIRGKKPDEMFINELLTPDPLLKEKDKYYMLASGYDRLLWPLYNFLMPLLVCAIMLTGDYNRRGQTKRIIACVVIAVALISTGIMAKNMVRAGNSFGIPLMFMPSAAIILFSAQRLLSSKRIRFGR